MATLDREHDRTVADIVTLTEIPAPPFKEAAKGKAILAMMKAEGLADVEMDPEGNVMGLRRGTGPTGAPLVVFAAHQDTVFPEGTPVKVKREGTKLSAPGVGDDTRSLAVMLAYIRALDAAKIATRSDILFVANVGEEGPGDLRGTRYLFGKGKYKDRIKAFFSMDGLSPSGVTNGAVGSRRYRVAFHGPGGHSYGAFGIVNPMSAMGHAVDQLYDVKVPTSPKGHLFGKRRERRRQRQFHPRRRDPGGRHALGECGGTRQARCAVPADPEGQRRARERGARQPARQGHSHAQADRRAAGGLFPPAPTPPSSAPPWPPPRPPATRRASTPRPPTPTSRSAWGFLR